MLSKLEELAIKKNRWIRRVRLVDQKRDLIRAEYAEGRIYRINYF